VLVVRKRIKNLNLTVRPPDGRVRVSAPLRVKDSTVRKFILSRLDWIKKHQARIQELPGPLKYKFVSGEEHYLWGKRYQLEVVERRGRHEVVRTEDAQLRMYVQPNTTSANREKTLTKFYRAEMKSRLPGLIAKWEAVIGVQVADWGVKKMKTRWGSCNLRARRVWLNLELAKRPLECLEYILVHEMVHLLEQGHNKRFYRYMDKFMPEWRMQRKALNARTSGHRWSCHSS
jgi:predicted metal-dependent hydrolase